MAYLHDLGLRESNFDRAPCVEVPGYENACRVGWDAVGGALREAAGATGKADAVVAVDAYSGVLEDEVRPALEKWLGPTLTFSVERDIFRSPEEVQDLTAPWVGGDDPLFGRFAPLELADFLDPDRRADCARRCRDADGLVMVYGPGAMLCCDPDIVVYADMARWEAHMRQRANKIDNLGLRTREERATLQYKRSYFVDWRACDRHKRTTFERWDFLLDTCAEGEPKLVSGDAFRAGLEEAARRPFSVVPFFDPGVWGGQWMREICDLPDDAPNYAWCFNCVPEENSLLLAFGAHRVEIPSINLVLRHPEELLGEPVHGRFGAEFPIRFDFLDTMRGQNLSFQVHPSVDYARDRFGLSYTQDESYYILDAEPDAQVYLGLKDGVSPEAMMGDLRTAAEDPSQAFPDERHVARYPARKHDHFLIPAGTCHCSGAGCLVLEISHTPYIFTFKLWDWARLGLDGQPRPTNLDRGEANIRWDRTESWVRPRLINDIREIRENETVREESTGLYRSQAFETRRHWFTGTARHDTLRESVHVLNLVEGAEAVVESPEGAFAPFVVHYAETFIVPAAVGAYTVRPHGPAEGSRCATAKAFLRVNA